MPQHPADNPVLLLDAGGVAAKIVDHPGLRPCHSVDAKDLAVCYRLADLCVAVRRFDGRVPAKRWNENVLTFGHSSTAFDCLFLRLQSDPEQANKFDFSYLHHSIHTSVEFVVLVQAKPFEEACFGLALSQCRPWRRHRSLIPRVDFLLCSGMRIVTVPTSTLCGVLGERS
jgi:hypothetical protein